MESSSHPAEEARSGEVNPWARGLIVRPIGLNGLSFLVVVMFALGGGPASEARDREPETLSVSGTIEARQVEAAFNQGGLVEAVLVDEGDTVVQGQLLARLDSRRLTQSLAQAQAAAEAAEAQLPLLEVSLDQAEQTSKANLAQAEAGVTAAEAGVGQAQAARKKAEVEAERRRKDWNRIKPLHDRGAASGQSSDQTKAALDEAESDLNLTQAAFDQARSKLALARAELALARAGALEPERIRQQIVLARIQVKQAQAGVGILEQTIRETEIKAPSGGRVLSRNVEPGEFVSPGTGVVTLADVEHVWLRAYVPETHLGRLKVGQEVKVKVDSFPQEEFRGRLSFINDEAEFTPKAVQTKEERVKTVFRIKVDLENPELKLKPGMPADAWLSLVAP